tara:strand:- start:4242 stop:4625 length:384 start_codon:yes stop_codon:yes gene_type:complete
MKYSDILMTENKENKQSESLTVEILDAGYSVLKKDKFNRTIIINPKKYNLNKEAKKLEQKKEKYLSMIDNWNNYRDSLNELYGDRSIYHNYKYTIQNIVDEDNILLEKIYELANNISINDNHSDEEI